MKINKIIKIATVPVLLMISSASYAEQPQSYWNWRPSLEHWNGDCCWGRHGEFEYYYFQEFWNSHPKASCKDVPKSALDSGWTCPVNGKLTGRQAILIVPGSRARTLSFPQK